MSDIFTQFEALEDKYTAMKVRLATALAERDALRKELSADKKAAETERQRLERELAEARMSATKLLTALTAAKDELAEARAEIARLKRLALEATNGWACYATRKIEHDDISRLHQEIRTPAETKEPR